MVLHTLLQLIALDIWSSFDLNLAQILTSTCLQRAYGFLFLYKNLHRMLFIYFIPTPLVFTYYWAILYQNLGYVLPCTKTLNSKMN